MLIDQNYIGLVQQLQITMLTFRGNRQTGLYMDSTLQQLRAVCAATARLLLN